MVANPDDPSRPINSPANVYQIEHGTLALLRTFGSDVWEKNLADYLQTHKTLQAEYARRGHESNSRNASQWPADSLVTGRQNVLIAEIIEKVLPPIYTRSLIVVDWPPYARLVRGDILSVREEDFVKASRGVGASHLRIITRHVLPNSIYPVLIMASLDIGAVVLSASALSFLGLGVPEGYADWGQMISFSRNWIVGTPSNPFAIGIRLLSPVSSFSFLSWAGTFWEMLSGTYWTRGFPGDSNGRISKYIRFNYQVSYL